MSFPALYAVVDEEACARAGRAPADVVRAYLGAGVTLLQVRGKRLGSAALLDLTRQAVLQAGRHARVIVNDRPDIAVLAEAGGVHVGQDDLSAEDARSIVGEGRWVGLSTHGLEQTRVALESPVDYVAIGPVFDTGTKATGYTPLGLATVEAVSTLAAARGVPVVAIGGITLERAVSVLQAGASSVCVISDLLVGDPEARARAFLARTTALQSGPGG